MPWFKVDDKLWGHPKWVASPAGARALWVTAGAWCADQLTDGAVPAHMLALFGGRLRDANALVKVGLWDETPTGFVFHDWKTFQPSREMVELGRRADAARQSVARNPAMRKAIRDRDGDVCRYCGATVQWSDKRGSLGGTYDHVDPDGPSDLGNLVVCCRGCNASKGRRTPDQAGMELSPIQIGFKSELESDSDRPSGVRAPRPDPTRPVVPTELLREGGHAKRGTRIPDDFAVTEAMREWATTNVPGMDIDYATKMFVLHFQGASGQRATMVKWDAAWKKWMLRDFKPQLTPVNGNRYFGKPGERKSYY